MKRINSFFVFVFLFIYALNIPCFAQDEVKVSYVNVNLPEVVINVYSEDDKINKESIKVVFDSKQLSVKSAEKFSPEKHKEHIFILVDLSASITLDYFNNIKTSIESFARSVGSNTYFTLITFGNDVSVPLQYTNNSNELIKTVNELNNTQSNTKLFSALSKAIDISNSSELSDMEYAIIISDGEDCQFGDVSEKEVEKQLENAAMPLYVMCADTGKVSSKDIENVRTLVSLSNGKFYLYKANETESVFNNLLSYVHSQNIIKAYSNSNVFNGSTQSLFVKINDIQSEVISVAAKSQTDLTPPSLSDHVEFDKKTNTLKFYLSEAVITSTGEKPSNSDFSLKSNTGKGFAVESLMYYEDNNQFFITVTPKKVIPNGKYILQANKITDNSIEKNELQDLEFSVVNGHSKIIAGVINCWYFLVIIILACLLFILVLLIIRKIRKPIIINGSKQENVVIDRASGLNITLYVDSGDGIIKTVKYELIKSAIVGRSKNCDITIADAKMSRQHFCLGIEKNNLVVADLNTTNGTYLNGIIIKSPQILKSGDRVYAGVTTISIEF